MAATLDRAPRVSRRARLAAVVEKLVDSWSRGVEALDVGDVFAEYLELRPDDAPKLEALAAREARQGAAALRRYFEAQLADATVAAELDRLDGLDAAPQTRPLERGLAPGDVLRDARVGHKVGLRDRLRAECERVEARCAELEGMRAYS